MLSIKNSDGVLSLSPKFFYTIAFLLLTSTCGTLSEAVAQDNTYIENKILLELSPVVFSKGLPENWRLQVSPNAEPLTFDKTSGLCTLTGDNKALLLTPDTEPITLVSPVISVDASCSAVTGVLLGTGANDVDPYMQWLSEDNVLATVPLTEPPVSNAENRRFNLGESAPPDSTTGLQLLVTVKPTDNHGAFHCTTVRLSGTFQEHRRIDVFCNKIGYDQIGPKSFVVRSNFAAQKAFFTLNDIVGEEVLQKELGAATRIQGANGTEWEGFYYRGDFYSYEEEGVFSLTVTLDDQPPVTVPVRIGSNLLIHEAFAPVLAPFARFRAKNTDDTLQLWEAAYIGDTTEPALLWDLVRSWSIIKGLFQSTAAFQPLNDEVLYALEKVAHWVLSHDSSNEVDFVAQTYYAASLACGARYYKESQAIQEAATQLAENTIKNNLEGVLPFSIVMDMFETTNEQQYLEYAERIFPGVSINRVESLLLYENYKTANVTIKLSNMLNRIAEKILKTAENPFGLPKSITENQLGFFLWKPESPTPLKGNNARILAIAEIMAQAYRYAANYSNRDFVFDQLNWILGNNPYDVCLIAGLCNPENPLLFLPEGMTATDANGFVLHGIGPRSINEDTPCFAVTIDEINENTNGFSLYNNARYICAMAYLKRIPVVLPL